MTRRRPNRLPRRTGIGTLCLGLLLTGCLGSEPEGLAPAMTAATTVKMDFYHRPLPEIPLPNDIATRYDPGSATGRRINASMLADTRFESRLRQLIDQLDGWGVFQPITIPFTGPLDVESILKGHRDLDYDTANDVVYLINVDRDSTEFGKIHHLDLGNGNYPVVLEKRDNYWKNDQRASTMSLLFEEVDEDKNGNGRLDPGEDTDADGVLDTPNYLPGKTPADDDLAARADALMTFYEKETNTLILRLMTPLRERTTYAVVVTRRLKDAQGGPVGSPFPYINHVSQNDALSALPELLPKGTSMEDVAFAFSYTTQSIQSHMIAVRDGLYGHGIQAHLGQNFPAEVASLEPLKDTTFKDFKNSKNPYALFTEQFLPAYDLIAQQLLNRKQGTEFYDWALDAQHFVDFHAIGSFKSPQLFMRTDKDGRPLGLNDQSWPADLDRSVAPAREETVYFWLVVPRKEISARGKGKPAPVVVLSHGYTSNRFEALAFGAYLARFGLATLAIDCVSHGLGLSKSEELLAKALTGAYGLQPFLEAALKDRAADLNGDGAKNSGGDFWTAYAFHTRDVVRQSALDYMQLIRVFRAFDGSKTWTVDTNGDGKNDIAGDFDGDGVVDVGGPAGAFHMTGGSLGGIMSLFVGGIEPAITSIAPIAGAAGLGEVAVRSRQGGVPEPVFLRVMGPLFVGTWDKESGTTKIETIVVDTNDRQELHIADVSGVRAGDTVVVQDMDNKELGCSYVTSEGAFRVHLAADLHDRVRLLFYSGDALAGKDCKRRSGVQPRVAVNTFHHEVVFQAETYESGSPLLALAEGLGLHRANPELRRLIGWKQMILDPGDPISYARNYQLEPITYDGTGEKTGTHTLMVPTIGDMNVPMNTGVAAARASGLLDYLVPDSRYGKSPNQVLIDTFAMEATDTTNRFTDSSGRGVHMDVDNFSEGKDRFGAEVPRLDPPLRVGLGQKDRLGGASAMVLPISSPQGTHGFDFPGEMTDAARKDCKNACTDNTGPDPCGCNAMKPFDIGFFMFNLLGNYFISDGKQIKIEDCYGYDTCPDKLPVPALRDKATLP